MTSPAKTPDDYLAGLPEERRAAISTIRQAILAALPPGYAEVMQYGMIAYVVPHSLYPAGYHCDPKQAVPFVCVASQKNHMAVYLTGISDGEAGERFQARYEASGKKLDKGSSCVRFRRLDDLCLEAVEEVVASMPVDAFLERYVASIPPSKRPKTAAS